MSVDNQFDPEKVERWNERTRCTKPYTAPDEPYTSVVRACDYDRLLEQNRSLRAQLSTSEVANGMQMEKYRF